MLQTKTIQGGRIKAMDDTGKGVAVIATLNTIDHDDDVTMPGAFGVQEVQMVPAHDWQHIPIGKAVIREVGNEVVAEFQLNMELMHGQQWHQALKFDLAQGTPLQEWSYGFRIDKASHGDRDGRGVRFLEAVTVREISPVLAGAGIGTRTVALKRESSMRFADELRAVHEDVTDIIARTQDIRAKRQAEGRDLSEDRRAELKALAAALRTLTSLSDALDEAAKATDDFSVAAEQLLAEYTRINSHR